MDMMNRSSAFYMGRIITFYAVSGFGSLAFLCIYSRTLSQLGESVVNILFVQVQYSASVGTS